MFGPNSPGVIPGVLAFDGWSSDSNDSFIAIFVYFERGQGLEVRLLGVKNLEAGHDAHTMAKVIQQTLRPYPHLAAWAAVADTTRVNPATCRELQIEFFPCMIHVLQLSVNTIISCKPDNPIGPLLERVNDVIGFFRKSCIATEELKRAIQHCIDDHRLSAQEIGRKTKLKANNATRWTSTEEALARFLLLWPAVHDVLVAREKYTMVLTQTEIDQLTELRLLLSFPKEVVMAFEAHGTPAADVSLRLSALLIALHSARVSFKSPAVAAVKDRFVADLESRLFDLPPLLQRFIMLSLPVPQYKNHGLISNGPVCAAARADLQQLFQRAKALSPPQQQQQPRQEPAEPARQASTIMADIMETGSISTTQLATAPGDELDRYMGMVVINKAQSALEWWACKESRQAFPILSTIASKFLTVPASTSDVERLFSSTKIVTSGRRSNMSPEILEFLMLIKANSQI